MKCPLTPCLGYVSVGSWRFFYLVLLFEVFESWMLVFREEVWKGLRSAFRAISLLRICSLSHIPPYKLLADQAISCYSCLSLGPF